MEYSNLEDTSSQNTTDKNDQPTTDSGVLSDPATLTDVVKQAILVQSIEQLKTSRNHKKARLLKIKENEDLYHNKITEVSLRNPFNECFPYMAGFIDHLKSNIDDDSTLVFKHTAEADLKKAQKIQAFYDEVVKSIKPNDSWDLKHRYAKTNAIFSGVAIYKYFAQSSPEYQSNLEVISHYDFHNEPRGGGQIENHLFCGQDNIFRNSEELKKNTQYEAAQVEKLTSSYTSHSWKDNDDYDAIRNNRYEALDQQPQTNNYVGQSVIKLVEWYTTYKGKRYYILFNERASIYLRCVELTQLFPENEWPYVCWHTNEDPDVFWSKAPADDPKAIALLINKFLNQELYNRQKENEGRELFDPDMVPNVAALTNSRPDAKIPIDTKNGTRALSSAVFKLPSGAMGGTLPLLTWLEQFTGKQIGYTSSSAGQSENDKKVGVYQGEIEQIDKLINIKNKSFRDALSKIGAKFKCGLDYHMTTEVSVQIMGGKGVEWQKLTPEDLKTERPLNIQPIGGTSELKLKEIEKNKKIALLQSGQIQTVNPQWKDRQLLLLLGFTTEDLRDAFSPDSFAEKELMSEAAMAEKDIVEGKNPPLNKGASTSFMQHIVDFATNTDNLDIDVYNKLMEYAMAHKDIVINNMNRDVKKMLADRAKARLSTGLPTSIGGDTMNTNGNRNISTITPQIPESGQSGVSGISGEGVSSLVGG